MQVYTVRLVNDFVSKILYNKLQMLTMRSPALH